jgi:hypothetical protein
VVLILIFITSCTQNPPAEDKPQETDSIGLPVFSESKVMDIVWEALEPNTTSHDRTNWQLGEIRTAKGVDVIDQFLGEPLISCWYGPKPPENSDMNTNKLYWYVFLKPVSATPLPPVGTPSPTGPPNVPEPFLKYAYFLVDPVFGNVVARKLICIVY